MMYSNWRKRALHLFENTHAVYTLIIIVWVLIIKWILFVCYYSPFLPSSVLPSDTVMDRSMVTLVTPKTSLVQWKLLNPSLSIHEWPRGAYIQPFDTSTTEEAAAAVRQLNYMTVSQVLSRVEFLMFQSSSSGGVAANFPFTRVGL